MGWIDATRDDAQKILGKDAELPDEKPDMLKLSKAYQDAYGKFDDLRSKLEDTIQDFEDALTNFSNGLKTNKTRFEKTDFGLDAKSKDDAKKIAQASKLFSDLFKKFQTTTDNRLKEVSELNKHVIQLRQYKAPKD